MCSITCLDHFHKGVTGSKLPIDDGAATKRELAIRSWELETLRQLARTSEAGAAGTTLPGDLAAEGLGQALFRLLM